MNKQKITEGRATKNVTCSKSQIWVIIRVLFYQVLHPRRSAQKLFCEQHPSLFDLLKQKKKSLR